MEKFKVLLVYPNLMLVSTLPNNIALLASCIKKEGHDVKVFDTTLYQTTEITNDELRVERMQVRPFDMKKRGVETKGGDVYEDFIKVVDGYKPNLIAVTVVDDTVEMGLSLIDSLDFKNKNIPIVFGGVHVFFNKEELIKNENIDMLCIGEGEETIVELCYALKNGLSAENIKNLWVKKKNGKVIKNQLRPPVDINNLPFEDFTVFEKKRLYRPMQGKIVSTVPINFDRGCPYQCTFCDAPSINKMFQEIGCYNYYRQKNIERIRSEIQYQVKKHNIEYLYFNSETFLSMPIQKLKEFAKMYSEFKIPFWCQTRIETVTEEKMKLLKEMNCDRISVGIEHGNENFRKNMLKKTFSNKDIIRAFEILNTYKLKVSVNNMIGFPDETRELIFDTINLNRKIKADSVNGFIFQPYLGTALREYCVKKGYLSNRRIAIGSSEGTPIGTSPLKMPQISKEELEGLLRTFVLYIKMPKSYFPKIKKAEQLNEEGNKVLSELREIFFKKYF